MTTLFWKLATSTFALEIDGVILLAALVIGFVPLVKYIPVVGPYVPVARLISVLMLLTISFMLGVRTADERATLEKLRATLAAKQADLDNAAKSLADESERAKQIEAAANAQHETDAQYIASLQTRPACLLDDGDLRGLGGLRDGSGSGANRAGSPSGAR